MPASTTPEPSNHPAATTTSTNQQNLNHPALAAPGTNYLGPESRQAQPRIPAKSPMRRSGDFSREVTRDSVPSYPSSHYPPGGFSDTAISPIEPSQPPPFARRDSNTPPGSPSRQNFSYPSRTNIQTTDRPIKHNPSTINDLKLAAKGLHVRVPPPTVPSLNKSLLTRTSGRRRDPQRHAKQHNRFAFPLSQHRKSRPHPGSQR
jgi:hypothetical protein